jgi:hypothetical protein
MYDPNEQYHDELDELLGQVDALLLGEDPAAETADFNLEDYAPREAYDEPVVIQNYSNRYGAAQPEKPELFGYVSCQRRTHPGGGSDAAADPFGQLRCGRSDPESGGCYPGLRTMEAAKKIKMPYTGWGNSQPVFLLGNNRLNCTNSFDRTREL